MRFITEDTNKGDIKDPLSLNLYVYCKGNPVRYYDRDGHKEEEINDQDVDGIPSSNNNTGLGTPINNEGSSSIGGGGGIVGSTSTIGNTGGGLGSVDKLPAPINNVFLRGITKAAEVSKDLFQGLKFEGFIKSGGRSGGIRPLEGIADSYVITEGGHTLVYDEGGKLIYDISSARIKMSVWNKAPNGVYYRRDIKLIGPVPPELLK